MRLVIKPWGSEQIWTENGLYVMKTLSVKAGRELSLQYHDEKTETLLLVQGEAELFHKIAWMKMQRNGYAYEIKPNEVHRIRAITDCKIVEASTPEKGNTFRISDNYDRPAVQSF
jgi:mannose-6-phosphate isomerase-like protein (cupin superfamily)